MLIGEAGFTAAVDHAAMLHAIHLLSKRRGHASILETLTGGDIPEMGERGYSLRRTWISQIDTSCRRPAAFPRRLDWGGVHQMLCARVVARVRAYLAGKLRNPCRGRPDQWRARNRPKLLKRIRAKGWKRIGCGKKTLQAYFATR